MFIHKHPYPPFIHPETERLIVGTLPPPRFSVGQLEENDVDFCYGSHHNSLWKYIDAIYDLKLTYDNSDLAVRERKTFLIESRIGVFDIVEQCTRERIDASDLGMTDVVLRDLIGSLNDFPRVKLLMFIGGRSKNGPEYFFRKHARDYDIRLKTISDRTPRQHAFMIGSREIRTVSLTSSSGAANISIASSPEYKEIRAKYPDFSPFDYRVMQYKEFL